MLRKYVDMMIIIHNKVNINDIIDKLDLFVTDSEFKSNVDNMAAPLIIVKKNEGYNLYYQSPIFRFLSKRYLVEFKYLFKIVEIQSGIKIEGYIIPKISVVIVLILFYFNLILFTLGSLDDIFFICISIALAGYVSWLHVSKYFLFKKRVIELFNYLTR